MMRTVREVQPPAAAVYVTVEAQAHLGIALRVFPLQKRDSLVPSVLRARYFRPQIYPSSILMYGGMTHRKWNVERLSPSPTAYDELERERRFKNVLLVAVSRLA